MREGQEVRQGMREVRRYDRYERRSGGVAGTREGHEVWQV